MYNNQISTVWESPVPSHGGFNKISMQKWDYNGTPYVDINFHYAQGVGHIDYNYFLVNGLTSPPHLLMTYKGINFRRTIANVNNDKYPDYLEYLYIDTGTKSNSNAILYPLSGVLKIAFTSTQGIKNRLVLIKKIHIFTYILSA